MLALLASAWTAFKGSKVAEYLVMAGAAILAVGLAVLELLRLGRSQGRLAANNATLCNTASTMEKANEAAADARADGAANRLREGSF